MKLLRDLMAYAAVRVVLLACSLLPLRLARGMGRAAGRLVHRLGHRSIRIASRNLELAFPEQPLAARQALLADSLQATGGLIAEMGLLWCARPESALAKVESVTGADLLDRGGQQGLLVMSPHLGNWELLCIWLAVHGPITVMYERSDPERLAEWIRGRRARNGARLVTADRGGVRAMYRALRAGETVGLLPDQVPSRLSGVHVPFFATDALTMTLVRRLLRSTGARAVFGSARRTQSGFALAFTDSHGLDDEDPLVAARALNSGLERCILEAPEQYQWVYKRYKRASDGRRVYGE